MDVALHINRIAAALLDPLSGNQLKETTGELGGELRLSGKLAEIDLTGKMMLRDVATKVATSNMRYQLPKHELVFSTNLIDLGRFKLKDEKGRESEVWGNITHKHFQDIRLNLNFRTEGLQVLNTTRNDNNLFFGTLFIQTTGQLLGPINDLKLAAQVKTLPGSELTVIPFGTEQEVKQEDFIVFGNPNEIDWKGNEAGLQILKKQAYGFQVSTNLEITPDLRLNVILDEDSGDQLYCMGYANLSVGVDMDGNTEVLGEYVFSEGKYNFSYEGLVKKEFEIQPESRLTFPGDPLDARFDFAAIYSTKTRHIRSLQTKPYWREMRCKIFAGLP